MHASNAARFEEGYRSISERLKIPGWNNPEVDILRLVNKWLSDEANGQWLMIIDNVDDATIFSYPARENKDNTNPAKSADRLSDFLPKSQNGSILVTTRSRDVAYRITGDDRHIIMVNPMDEELAMELLRKKLHGNFNEDDAKKLVHTLDYMPLAVSQAAAFISQRTPHTTISRYLQDLQKSDVDRTRLLTKNTPDTRRDGRASNSILATWQISFENIRKERPSAARLLSLMCLFDRQGIPKSLLNHHYGGKDEEEDFEEDIYTLHSYSMISANTDSTEFEMHHLVQFSTKEWLELRGELKYWKEKFINIMDEEFPVGRYENWAICQKLFPHVASVIDFPPVNPEQVARWASILFRVAWYANERGNYALAEKWNMQALRAYTDEIGPEHPSTLSSMANLALTYKNQGRWKEAEEPFVQAMKIRMAMARADHLSMLMSRLSN